MIKLLFTTIALTAIGVVVKAKLKSNRKIDIWKFPYSNKEDALIQLQNFINDNNNVYLGHEFDKEFLTIIVETNL